MDLMSAIKESTLIQMFFSITFIISGIIVVMVQILALLLVRPFNKRIYQIFVCKIVYAHWAQIIWMCDRWSGTEIRLFADDDVHKCLGTQHCVVISNHRQDVDWLAMWLTADRFHVLPHAKCLMKNDLKYIPLLGWSFWMLDMIFVKRDFVKDKKTLIDGFRNYMTYPLSCMILLFCEGTRLTPEKYAKSVAFAKEKGIEPLKHHLIPRTKGFVMAMEAFEGKVPVLYDTTFAVSKSDYDPTLLNIIRGKKFIFNFHIKSVPIEDVPEGEDNQTEFIHQMYREKDSLMDYFLKHDTFTGYDHRVMRVMPRRWAPVFIEIFWLSALGFPALYKTFMLLTSGSLWVSLTIIGFTFAVYYLLKYMISTTMVSKGSAYGKSPGSSSVSGDPNANELQRNLTE